MFYVVLVFEACSGSVLEFRVNVFFFFFLDVTERGQHLYAYDFFFKINIKLTYGVVEFKFYIFYISICIVVVIYLWCSIKNTFIHQLIKSIIYFNILIHLCILISIHHCKHKTTTTLARNSSKFDVGKKIKTKKVKQ